MRRGRPEGVLGRKPPGAPRENTLSITLDTSLDFEQGPIRPPSEAKSLLLRFTRNCPWNKCKFCPVYKRRTFSRRSLEEIKRDIDSAAMMRSQILDMSGAMGKGGRVDDAVVQAVFQNPGISHAFRNVAAWLYYGAGNVFLQDANNLVMKPDALVEAIEYLRGENAGGETPYHLFPLLHCGSAQRGRLDPHQKGRAGPHPHRPGDRL